MAGSGLIDVTPTGMVMATVAGVSRHAGAVSADDHVAALVDEIGRLDEEGRRFQLLASRMARDSRPGFDAWFEAGLLLRRTNTRLAEITGRLI